MTHILTTIRPAATAIAAVLALSSTPLLAQVAEEPVTTTPVTDTVAPPPVESDPLAPAPTVETPEAETPAAAEPAAASPARTTRARTTATRPTRAQPPAPAAASAPPSAEPILAQPIAIEPVIAEPIAPPPAAVPAGEASAIDTFLSSDEALPIAGAAGLGILALAGAGLVARRRRRRRRAEDAEWRDYAENTAAAEAEPGEIAEPQRATMEPTFVRAFADAPMAAASAPVVAPTPPATAPVPTGPATALPKDFDLSRFGPHVQAAYRGPTKDNPSLSLKYRLRRAAALDQVARKAAPAPAQPAPAPAEPLVTLPARAVPQLAPVARAEGEFLLRRAATKPGVKPAFSK